jgi:anti-sigma factor RsiW
MHQISDETLMAFADGDLQPDERRTVREALTQDASLIEKLESFILTRTRIARLFDAVLAEPLPEKMLKLIRGC